MSTVQEVEEAVRHFSAEERAAFRAWFTKFIAEELDQEDSLSKERTEWLALSAQGLAKAYGDDEPEYTVADIIGPT